LEDYHSGSLTLEGGLRIDWVERDPRSAAAGDQDFTSFSVSGAALYDHSENWQLGLALSRAERAPSTEELFSNIEGSGVGDWVVHAATGAVEVGSADIDTEVSNNIDVSVRWGAGDHVVDLTLFYNDFEDYIALVNTGEAVGESPVLAYTQTDARFAGLEVDSRFLVASFGDADLTFGLFGDVIDAELDGGDDVPRLPPARIGARAALAADDWRIWSRFLYAADQDNPGVNEAPTDSYQRWDLGSEYTFALGGAQLLLSLEVNNLTDEDIRLSTSFLRGVAPEAGRSVIGTLRYSF
jgi:iron complex outermembrane receptor protein